MKEIDEMVDDKDDFVVHAYQVTVTDIKGRKQKTVIVSSFSEECAMIDAMDMNAHLGLHCVKALKQLPDIARYLVAFPWLVNVVFK